MERKYLRPNPTCPVPLKEDFWKVLINKKENTASTATVPSFHSSNIQSSNIEVEVRRVLQENKEFINDAVLKQVAPTATNIEGNQYENLVSLSFDQERLLQEEEDKRRRQREKVVSKVLR